MSTNLAPEERETLARIRGGLCRFGSPAPTDDAAIDGLMARDLIAVDSSPRWVLTDAGRAALVAEEGPQADELARLRSALERSEARCERLRRERDRLCEIAAWYEFYRYRTTLESVTKGLLIKMASPREIEGEVAAALAAHDREAQP